MRKLAIAIASAVVLLFCVLLGAHGRQAPAKVRLQFVDAVSGKKLGGMIRVFPAAAKEPVELPGMLDRLRGLKKSETLKGWYVVPAEGAETSLPKQRLRIEALSGLETARAQQEIDLSKEAPETITLKLNTLFHPEEHGLVAGNTHLHLQGLSKEECEDYLRHVPAADGIRVMFISYLERAEIDKAYITNRYPIGNMKDFETTGVLFTNGEEHRHNFDAWGQGYGHVMFLDIKELVQPVSLGPGITARGDDDRPLRPGIDEAHRQGGTVLWCHNTFGHESVASALSGRLDAWNVFDGTRAGSYEDKYYRCLNVGTRLPISTGTDWFIYDFSRVYARVEKPLTIRSWLAALKAGRNVVTNGPLL
ncbi:MAG TPA: CehA/McbA family metallohydrolase, partial [Gemmataceae bacterium]|nr:CehA/McbA family metallohydrolase [Gemmataceae bacterium]